MIQVWVQSRIDGLYELVDFKHDCIVATIDQGTYDKIKHFLNGVWIDLDDVLDLIDESQLETRYRKVR